MAFSIVRTEGDLTAKELLVIATSLEDEMKAVFLRVIRDAGAHFSMRNIEVAVRGGRELTDTIAKDIAKSIINRYKQEVDSAISGAANMGARTTGLPTSGARFRTSMEHAEGQARKFAGEHLKDVTEEVRGSVRQTIADSIEEGLSITDTADRVRQNIGLNRRQQVAVTNYRKRLETPKGRADHQTRLYARMLTASRAQTIASTEVMFAMNAGRQEMWKEARASGLIPRNAKKVWVTSEDERTCVICEPMHEQEVTFDRQFRVRYPMGRGDEKRMVPKWLMFPPSHPNCRCVVMLVTDL